MPRGNCYASSEALYHILGGAASGWKPKRMRLPDGETHWWLERDGVILDPSRLQFKYLPQYALGKGAGFLTKRPSKRARALMEQLTWQVGVNSLPGSPSDTSRSHLA